MVQIIPTLFSLTEEDYKKRIEKVLNSEALSNGWVHMDLMDTDFVQNRGVSLDVLSKYPLENPKEAHLMVGNPKEWIEGLSQIKVQRIIFPLEIDNDIESAIKKIKEKKIEASLSINPETNLEKLEPFIEELDGVLIMGIRPGSEGQTLNPITYEKIRTIKDKGWRVTIGVDGGVNDTTIKELVRAGVDYVAVGSFLFRGDIDENLEKLWEALK